MIKLMQLKKYNISLTCNLYQLINRVHIKYKMYFQTLEIHCKYLKKQSKWPKIYQKENKTHQNNKYFLKK